MAGREIYLISVADAYEHTYNQSVPNPEMEARFFGVKVFTPAQQSGRYW